MFKMMSQGVRTFSTIASQLPYIKKIHKSNNFITCYRRSKEDNQYDDLAKNFKFPPNEKSNRHVVYDYGFYPF